MTTTIANRGLPAAEDIVGPTPGQQMRRRIFGHFGLLFGGTILGIMFLMAILAPLIAPHDP
ncbi:MAG: ABC transporter permease, partial [Nisaea sp.]